LDGILENKKHMLQQFILEKLSNISLLEVFHLQSIMSRAQFLTVSTSFIANIFSLRGTERAFELSWIVCCNFASKTLISSFNLPVVACERKRTI